jgi:hypothetical protein
MLNLKTQDVSHGEENLDDNNPFSPTFGAHAQHVYIPLVPHQESKYALCKNVCCFILSVIVIGLIVVVVIVLIQ